MARVIRARIAASAAPSDIAGSTTCAHVPLPETGSHPNSIEKTIANDRDGRLRWGRKQYATLEQLYRQAPYFQLYAPALQHIFDAQWERLIDLNLALLHFCVEALDIRTPIERTSTDGTLVGKSVLAEAQVARLVSRLIVATPFWLSATSVEVPPMSKVITFG